VSRSRTSPEGAAGAAPLLIVLTAPSGTGKTTMARRVLAADERLAFSVSHTTRPPRGTERGALDYWFVDDTTFDQMVEKGSFVEWAHVHQRRYGTSHEEVERLTAAGRDVLFDIDPQGGVQVMEAYPEAVTVFVVPPSLAELEQRLRGRGTEAEKQVQVRLANARREIGYADRYDYVIVNDDLDRAVEALAAVVVAERRRTARQGAVLARLRAEIERGD
jgi:guanylate kinase